jgi:hypothetical protein
LPLLFASPLRAQGTAPAGGAAGVPEFAPPPVPGFMLKKPEKPLSLEEMQRQADEAARRSRQGAPVAGQPASPPPPAPAGAGK